MAAPAYRTHPLGGHRDLRLLERVHGRCRALRRARGVRGAVGGYEHADRSSADRSWRSPACAVRPSCWPSGETTSEELVELALARIEDTQPTLNAFRCLRAEAAPVRGRRGRPAAGGGRPGAAAGRPGGDQGRHRPVRGDDRVRLPGPVRAQGPGQRGGAAAQGWPARSSSARRPPPSWASGRSPRGRRSGSRATRGVSTIRPEAPRAGLQPRWPLDWCPPRWALMGSARSGSRRRGRIWSGIKPQRGRISTWPYARRVQRPDLRRAARPQRGRRSAPAGRQRPVTIPRTATSRPRPRSRTCAWPSEPIQAAACG